MISIASAMDEFDIAQEIRIERQVHKGAFLLLEGQTDVNRFAEFVDDVECSIVNCYGRPKAIGAVEILYDEGFEGALAVVDADFDRVLGSLKVHEGVIYSEGHDFDVDWAQPEVIRRYLLEAGDDAKCAALGGYNAIMTLVRESLKPISVARYLNQRGNIRYRLSGIYIDRCYANMQVDIDAYVALIFENRTPPQAEKDAVKGLIEQHSKAAFDLLQITNGHDFATALGVCLRDQLGARKIQQSYGSEVEMHVRLIFNDAHFKATRVYREIRIWEDANRPYIILDNRLRQ
ncbi:MAG: hypothetical protein K0Q54_1977 [Methylobacterium brachiatum]|nr:hypothetical protein [Methylobacterium brachiatum]